MRTARHSRRPGLEPLESRLVNTAVVESIPEPNGLLRQTLSGSDSYELSGVVGGAAAGGQFDAFDNFDLDVPEGTIVSFGFASLIPAGPHASVLTPTKVLSGHFSIYTKISGGSSVSSAVLIAQSSPMRFRVIADDLKQALPYRLNITARALQPSVDLRLSAADSVLDLLKPSRFVVATPSTAAGATTSVTIQSRRQGNQGDWRDVATLPSKGADIVVQVTPRLAGFFDYRARATYQGREILSNVVGLETRFPLINEITADDSVSRRLRATFRRTQAAAVRLRPQNLVQEFGYFILLDTRDGTYSATPTIPSEPFNAQATAFQFDFPIGDPPADMLRPDGTAIYAVARFHTHPSIEFIKVRPGNLAFRIVGPSSPDIDQTVRTQMPGVVFDYLPKRGLFVFGRPAIPAGHPTRAPGRAYTFGETRRSSFVTYPL